MNVTAKISALVLVLTTGTSCNQISTAKVDQMAAASANFPGATRIALQSKGSYVLTWPELQQGASKKDATYDVYGFMITDQTAYPSEIFSATGETVDATSSFVTASLTDSISPAGKAIKIGSAVSKNSYEVSSSTILTANGVYLFQVRVNSSGSNSKVVDTNSNIVAFRYGVAASKALSEHSGCLSVTPISTSSVKVVFKIPTGADKIEITRNGTSVTTIDDVSITSYTDIGLSQGETYTYVCQAVAGTEKKKGTPITLTIPAVTPPTFTGISSVTATSASSLTVTWPLASGTPTYQYNIYCSAGATIDWTKTPVKSVAADGTISAVVSDLGDEIPYTCGVRACAYGNACDTNTVTIQKTTPDGGAAKSQGITGVSLVNGQAVVTAPWSLSNGAVWKRRVYICTGNIATCGTNLANYTLATTNIAAQIYTPNTSITLSTTISQNTTYSFLLTDEDPSGNVSSVQSTPTLLTTGDLTKPTFAGLSSLTVGTPANQSDTTLSLNFTAIARESDDAVNGASHYQVYFFQGSGDACTSGTLRSEFSSASYTATTAYTYLASGLSPRTVYSFCLKARDSAGNVSNTTQYYTKQTQDITAPVFDGIQSIVYDANSGLFTASWTRSTSSDRSSYKMSISKNNGAYTTFTYTDAAQPSGISFTKTSLGFTFADNDLLKVYVNACDDASSIAGGTDNCTTLSTPTTFTVPDISPPSNFVGIDSSNTVNAAEGSVTVAWLAPTPVGTWASEGYRGFIVYSVDSSNNLTQLKNCACVQTDCSDHLTSCTVTGLDARRTYKFHVRAYDGSGNITTSLNPATSVATIQTTDTTAPTFNANVTASIVSSAVQVSWGTATDNQYASESGAAVTYQIYRKTGSDFASYSSPQTGADVGFPVTQTTSPYNEAAVAAGTTYYYTICAKDASNNRTCAASSTSIVPTDITAPTLSGFTSNKTSSMKSWNLSWTMSDNVTASGSLQVLLYASYTDTASTATTSDTLLHTGLGTTSRTSMTGPQNANKYVNYLLVVSDAAGNSTTATLSVYSTNLLTITSITRNSGTTAGGKYVFIKGTGFDSTATVTIANQSCTNSTVYYTSTMMGCTTPAAAAGTYNIVVTNSEGSTATASYTYYAYTGAGSDHICDNPTQPTATFNSGGGGSAIDPYLICTPTQFMLIGAAATSKFFKLMDNLDVSSWNTNNFGAQSFTSKTLNGNSMTIANWTRAYAAGLPAGYGGSGVSLGLLIPNGSSVTDLYMMNVNLNLSASPGAAVVGALAGWVPGAFTTSNVVIQGSITGTNTGAGQVGGLFAHNIGAAGGSHTNDSFTGTLSGIDSVGGLVAYVNDGSVGTTFTNNSTSGTFTSTGNYVGGMIGQWSTASAVAANLSMSGCSSSANISANSLAGGLIGAILNGPSAYGISITSSYATGTVTTSSTAGTTVNTGGLIGDVSGLNGTSFTLSSSYATGAVSGYGSTGGLIGRVSSLACTTAGCFSISNSYATGNVTSGNGGYVGGFIGNLFGNTSTGSISITGSYATGNVAAASGSTTVIYGGGFIGYLRNSYSISSSYATGNVTIAQYLGGFLGYANEATANGVTQTVQTSYSSGTVTGTGATVIYAGGFVGYLSSCTTSSYTIPTATYSQNYSSSNVSGPQYIGGFIGIFPGAGSCSNGAQAWTVTDCYASGTVAGTQYIGGFVGRAVAGATFNRVFATGIVSASSNSGGLVANTSPGSVTDSFWDQTRSLQSTSVGGGTAKSTTQMQTQSTFTNFDFTTTPVWKISAGQYPKLNWQP